MVDDVMLAVETRISLRRCRGRAEYAQCVELQEETWGAAFSEKIPATLLQISDEVGGVTAGAFAQDGRLLGFVFGLTGVKDGRLVHWSDMLAVRPEARNGGLGMRLKLFQRELLQPLAVEQMFWTFDPLVAKNAHLNLTRLGARVARYVADMYGADTGSALHSGLGTDRMVVVWDLQPEMPSSHLANGRDATLPTEWVAAPIVNVAADRARPRNGSEPDAPLDHNAGHALAFTPIDVPCVRIAIPGDIQTVKEESSHTARAWRETTRAAFQYYLDRGYTVSGFRRVGANGEYLLRER